VDRCGGAAQAAEVLGPPPRMCVAPGGADRPSPPRRLLADDRQGIAGPVVVVGSVLVVVGPVVVGPVVVGPVLVVVASVVVVGAAVVVGAVVGGAVVVVGPVIGGWVLVTSKVGNASVLVVVPAVAGV
jgi:hypothetical protein